MKNVNIPNFPYYPFLLGLFPVLFLWNSNRAQEPAYVVVPSLLVTLAFLLVFNLIFYAIWLALWQYARPAVENSSRRVIGRIRRRPVERGEEKSTRSVSFHQAALPAALLGFFLLSYGQFSHLLRKDIQPYLLPVTGALLLALFIFLGLRRVGGPSLTRTLNLIAAALVLFQLVTAAPYYFSIARLRSVSAKAAPSSGSAQAQIPATGGPQRDVYFILLDNYGREDILQQGSGFDNSALISALKERGFLFPDCAQGNYMWTAPVISSILNMNYLDVLGVPDKDYIKRGSYEKLAPLLQDSLVIKKFREYGYHVVTFRGFMGLMDIQNTDTYISFDKDKSFVQRLETAKFQDLYFRTTIFYPLNEQYKIYPDWIAKSGPPALKAMLPKQSPFKPQFEEVYQQNRYAFDALERIPAEIQGPKFVYAHMYAAHWPFIMTPDGGMRLPFSEKLTRDGYVDGVRFTNSRLLGAIDAILNNSKVKPVIILQGDHSDIMDPVVEWAGTDRIKILSAYYLPSGGEKMLYDTISPVNNFRLVFQYYLGANISLLPDINRYLDPKTKRLQVAQSTCISTSK